MFFNHCGRFGCNVPRRFRKWIIEHVQDVPSTALLFNMQANPVGPKGITPLHLAALQEGGATAALILLDHCPPEEWTHCLTLDGLSPSDFARKAGNHSLERDISARLAAATFPPSFRQDEITGGGGAEAAVAKFGTSPTTSGSSKESGFCLGTGRCAPGRSACDAECVPGPNTVSDSEAGGSDSECELFEGSDCFGQC